MFIRWVINRLVTWVAGLSASDFKQIADWVVTANKQFSAPENATQEQKDAASDTKRNWVSKLIKSEWPRVANWAINLLRELAVAFIKKS